MFIKYIKSILWRVAKRLSYIEDARCLKVKQLCTSTLNRFSLSFRIIYKFHAFTLGTSGMICSCHSCEYEEHWLMTPCSLAETGQNLDEPAAVTITDEELSSESEVKDLPETSIHF